MRDKTIQVRVGNQTIQESNNEKLLGITMSNDVTWNALLNGNKLTGSDKEIGLLKQLSQRIGMLKQLSKYMSKSQLKTTCEGIFTSKVLYCLPLFSNVWGVMNMDDTALTKEDMRKLQVLHTKF